MPSDKHPCGNHCQSLISRIIRSKFIAIQIHSQLRGICRIGPRVIKINHAVKQSAGPNEGVHLLAQLFVRWREILQPTEGWNGGAVDNNIRRVRS
jgi:hypothetical protein